MKVVRIVAVAMLVSATIGATLAVLAIVSIRIAELRDQRAALNRAFQPRPYGSMR